MSECCPHCGYDQGVLSTYWEQRNCILDFKGGVVESDSTTGKYKFRKTGVCVDCGKTVRIPDHE